MLIFVIFKFTSFRTDIPTRQTPENLTRMRIAQMGGAVWIPDNWDIDV